MRQYLTGILLRSSQKVAEEMRRVACWVMLNARRYLCLRLFSEQAHRRNQRFRRIPRKQKVVLKRCTTEGIHRLAWEQINQTTKTSQINTKRHDTASFKSLQPCRNVDWQLWEEQADVYFWVSSEVPISADPTARRTSSKEEEIWFIRIHHVHRFGSMESLRLDSGHIVMNRGSKQSRTRSPVPSGQSSDELIACFAFVLPHWFSDSADNIILKDLRYTPQNGKILVSSNTASILNDFIQRPRQITKKSTRKTNLRTSFSSLRMFKTFMWMFYLSIWKSSRIKEYDLKSFLGFSDAI